MVCSPEQLAANRRNSKRSTGPKTTEGKAKSRQNGLKHGLTGAGVVIADEDVAAVEGRFEAFEADLKPANDVARFLARRAALLSVRLDRGAREEAARLNLEMLQAEDVEADERAEEFERLTRSIAENPGESVRKLRRSEEGIDWLLAAWRMARRHLLEPNALRWSSETALRLTGLRPGKDFGSRFTILGAAVQGSFHLLEESEWPDLSPLERRAAALDELTALVDRQIADLEAAREHLDRDRIAQVRAGAAARALFSPSREATLARKYEAAAERDFYRALQRIEQINRAAEEASEVEENPAPYETSDEMASSFPAEEAPAEGSPSVGDRPTRPGLDLPTGRRRASIRPERPPVAPPRLT